MEETEIDKKYVPHDFLKAMKKKTGLNLGDLRVMSHQNDPFNSGTKTHRAQAKWFKDVYEEYGKHGIHLRGLHYALITSGDEIKTDKGKTYKSDEDSWNYLTKSASHARYQGLVSPESFVDQKHPELNCYYQFKNYAHPHFDLVNRCKLDYPAFPSIEFFGEGDLWWVDTETHLVADDTEEKSGLGEPNYKTKRKLVKDLQPYYLEIWVEKTGLNEMLKSFCLENNVNLKIFQGYPSITAIIDFLKRVQSSKRPGHIAYISDYDPAGNNMPIAVSRQLEFWIWQWEISERVTLEKIAITEGQVHKHDFPHAPDKPQVEIDLFGTDKYRDVLLDELEKFIARYKDLELEGELTKKLEKTEEIESEIEDAVKGNYGSQIKESRTEIEKLKEKYNKKIKNRLSDLEEEYNEELREIKEKNCELRDKIAELQSTKTEESNIPRVPERGSANGDNGNALFDSSRDYLEQLKHYRQN